MRWGRLDGARGSGAGEKHRPRPGSVLAAGLLAVGLSVGGTSVAVGAPAAAVPTKPATTKAILRAGVMTARDVPSTWVSTPRSTSGSTFPNVAACHALARVENTARRHTPRALSSLFSDPGSGNTTQADDSVYAFADPKAAHGYVAAYQAATASSCFRSVLADAAGSSGTATVVSLTAQLQGLGDQNAGYEGTLQGTNSAGQPVALVVDLVTVRVGRAVATFEFLNANRQIAAGPTIVNEVIRQLRSA